MARLGHHVGLLLLAEHRQHAAGDGEAAEHVDGGQREADHGQAQDQVRPAGRTPPASGGAICTSAPMAMMLEMALVTLISGVCSAGVTFQTTM